MEVGHSGSLSPQWVGPRARRKTAAAAHKTTQFSISSFPEEEIERIVCCFARHASAIFFLSSTHKAKSGLLCVGWLKEEESFSNSTPINKEKLFFSLIDGVEWSCLLPHPPSTLSSFHQSAHSKEQIEMKRRELNGVGRLIQLLLHSKIK